MQITKGSPSQTAIQQLQQHQQPAPQSSNHTLDEQAAAFDLPNGPLDLQKIKQKRLHNRTQTNFMPSPKHNNNSTEAHNNSQRKLTAQHPSQNNMSVINQSLPYPYAIGQQSSQAPLNQQLSSNSPFTQSRYQFFNNNPQGMVKPQPTNKFYDTTFSKALLSHGTYERHSKKMQKYAEELQKLKEGGRSPLQTDDRSLMMKTQFIKSRQYSKQFHDSERVSGILKVNKNLAERLFDIQIGKKYQRNRSLIHNNVVTPNLSPIGSLSLPYKKKQAEQIDNANVKLMKKILYADSLISQKRFEEEFVTHKKYKKIAKKSVKHGFDIDRLTDQQKKHFNHIESKTSSQLFPPISNGEGGTDKRSKSQAQKKLGGGIKQNLSRRYLQFDQSTQRAGEHTIMEDDEYHYSQGEEDGHQGSQLEVAGAKKKKGKKNKRKQVPNFHMVNSEEEFSQVIPGGFLSKQPSPRTGIIPIVPMLQPESSNNSTHFNFANVQYNQKLLSLRQQQHHKRQQASSNFMQSMNETQNLYSSTNNGHQQPMSLAISPALQKVSKRGGAQQSLKQKHQGMPEVPQVVTGVRNRNKHQQMTAVEQPLSSLLSAVNDTSIIQYNEEQAAHEGAEFSTQLINDHDNVQLRKPTNQNIHDDPLNVSEKQEWDQKEEKLVEENKLQSNQTPFSLQEDD